MIDPSSLPATMTAEEIAFQLEFGGAIADLLPPILRVLSLIQTGEQRGWNVGVSEYREMLETVHRLLGKLGEVSAVTLEVQRHNEAYVRAEGATRH